MHRVLARWSIFSFFSFLIMDNILIWHFLLTAATFSTQHLSAMTFSRSNSSFSWLMETTTLAPLKKTGFPISTVVVYYCWFFVQTNVLWYFVDYHLLVIHFMASEDIWFFKPYITSKAIYQTAFGPRIFFNCSWLHYKLYIPSPVPSGHYA